MTNFHLVANSLSKNGELKTAELVISKGNVNNAFEDNANDTELRSVYSVTFTREDLRQLIAQVNDINTAYAVKK